MSIYSVPTTQKIMGHDQIPNSSTRQCKKEKLLQQHCTLAFSQSFFIMHAALYPELPTQYYLCLTSVDAFYQDGLTPLDLCLYSGHGIRTYELIRLLKQLPVSK